VIEGSFSDELAISRVKRKKEVLYVAILGYIKRYDSAQTWNNFRAHATEQALQTESVRSSVA
jgi:hypothetical protein